MKTILTSVAAFLPGAASACMMGMGGMGSGGAGGCPMPGHGCMMAGGGHLATVLMAATAALGWWVLRQSAKDNGAVRWAGQATGWILIVFGLGGFLCGSLSHGAKMAGSSRACAMGSRGPGMGAMQMPPGHPPIGDMPDAAPATPAKK